ncbi:hypothetical protein ABZP36_036051 [Zizania latifolia]
MDATKRSSMARRQLVVEPRRARHRLQNPTGRPPPKSPTTLRPTAAAAAAAFVSPAVAVSNRAVPLARPWRRGASPSALSPPLLPPSPRLPPPR